MRRHTVASCDAIAVLALPEVASARRSRVMGRSVGSVGRVVGAGGTGAGSEHIGEFVWSGEFGKFSEL